MLDRHKKKGYDGFKYFVQFLETLAPNKRREIIENSIIEDPVYMLWVLKNMIAIDYVFSLNSKEIETFFNNFSNVIDIMVKCFHKTPLEERIKSDFLPKNLIKDYEDQCEVYPEISASMCYQTRALVVERLRMLQDKGRIEPYSWKFPPRDIAYPELNKMRKGLYKKCYENGTVAMKGNVERTLRTGEWFIYYQDGELLARGQYYEGEKIGTWEFYYPNGDKKYVGTYAENLKEGTWLEFNEAGAQSEILYTRGKRAA